MKKVSAIICALALWILTASSQDIVRGKGAFQIDADFARYQGDSTRAYVEFYYGIHEDMLTYRPDSGRYAGAADLIWEIRGDSSTVSRKEWLVPHVVSDTLPLAKGQTLMGLQSVLLPAGDYNMIVSAHDVGAPSRRDSFAVPIRVNLFPPERESLSDIEFCTSIQSSTNRQSLFYKNTLEVIPNASKLYGIGLPIMYYYTEAYYLFDDKVDSTFTVRTEVLDAMGNVVLTKDRVKPRLHNSSVEVGTINLSTFHGGTYVFRVSLLDSVSSDSMFTTIAASTQKKFYVYKPLTSADTTGGLSELARNDFAHMTDVELNDEFARAQYVATDAEREQWQKLTDVTAKQKFLTEFWIRRDIRPETSVNEFREEYNKRVDFADEHYSVGQRQGWRTDRGRVYIVYGPPDEIDRSPSSSDSNPYEIWHYNSLQGGVIFVFVDRTGFSDYILVHSTYRDEIHDDQWYQNYAQKMR
jgi:GWxTD domain-containing protein